MKAKKKTVRMAWICAMAMAITAAWPTQMHAAASEDIVLTANEGAEGTAQEKGARQDQFDSTAPVIEGLELKEKGTTVGNKAELSLSVYAYDADSEIKEVRVSLSATNGKISKQLRFDTKGAAEHEYVSAYQLDGTDVGQLRVTAVEAVDIYGNKTIAPYTMLTENGIYKYWVDVEKPEGESGRVKEFTFPQNGKTVDMSKGSYNLYNGASLELMEGIGARSVYARFENETGASFQIYFLVSEDSQEASTVFKCSGCSYSSIGSVNRNGKYILKDVYASQGDFDVVTHLEMENKENYSFTLEGMETMAQKPPVIKSVEISHQGEIVREGDTVDITILAEAAEGTQLSSYGTVYFYSAAPNIDAAAKSVQLMLGEDGKYHGSLAIKDMYPCEWYINQISIYPEGGGSNADYGEFTRNGGYPYYVQVYNGESFVNPVYTVQVSFMGLNAEGNYVSISNKQEVKIERRQTLKDANVQFPGMASNYPGLTQTGWMDSSGRDITDSRQIIEGGYHSIYAKYDKSILHVSYNYPDDKGGWDYVTRPFFFERGVTTYGDILKESGEYRPENLTKEYAFDSWENANNLNLIEDAVISGVSPYLSMTAKLSGIVSLHEGRYYFNKAGENVYENRFLAVKEGTSTDDVKKTLNETKEPESYPGLRFDKWTVNVSNSDVIKNGQYVWISADYENCLIRYILNADEVEQGVIFCQVAEKGERVTALKSFEGFGEVTWENEPEETFVVDGNMTFYGTAVPTGDAASTNPPDATTPPNATNPPDTDPGQNDDVGKLPDSVVNDVIDSVKAATEGAVIVVPMKDQRATVISKEILEMAKGKNVNLKLEMDGYTWTMNGMDIQAKDLKDINLKVTPNTNNIQSSTVKALAGDNPTMQLNLAHEGNFGFKAELTIGVGKENTGKYGNLFYYDSSGKMVFIDAGLIDADGNVSMTFSHASDYVIVMADQEMSQPDAVLKGDADLNGKVNLDDAALVLKAALAIESLTGRAFTAADIDQNQRITLDDAQAVLKLALKIVE